MRAAVIGYYGENFGDLLMLSVIIQKAKPFVSVLQIFTYGNKASLYSYLSTVNTDSMRIDVIPLNEVGVIGFVTQVRGADLIMWGGGTCFMDEGGTGGVKYMFLAHLLGVPVYYLGVGIDSCRKTVTKMCILIAMIISRSLYFRDEHSRDVAKKYSFRKKKAKFIPDLAFSISKSSVDHVNVDFPGAYIAFCTRELGLYFGADAEDVNSQLCELALAIARKVNVQTIVLILADSAEDKNLSLMASNMLSRSGVGVEIVEGSDIQSTTSVIAGAKFLVSVRLHPAVVAHQIDVPYVLFNYSDKNSKFLSYVDSSQRLVSKNSMSIQDNWFDAPSLSGAGCLAGREVDSIINALFQGAAS